MKYKDYRYSLIKETKPKEPLYTIKEISNLLDVEYEKIKNEMIGRRKIGSPPPPKKVFTAPSTKTIYYRKSDFVKWLAELDEFKKSYGAKDETKNITST
jgi:hypothetical protein